MVNSLQICIAKRVEEFIAKHGMTKTDFGLLCDGSRNLYDRLTGDVKRGVTLSKADEVLRFMDSFEANPNKHYDKLKGSLPKLNGFRGR